MGGAPIGNSDGAIFENVYGQNSGRFTLVVRATGSDNTFSQVTFDLIIGEETAGGSFESGNTLYGGSSLSNPGLNSDYTPARFDSDPGNGVGYVASFHNNSTNFTTDSTIAESAGSLDDGNCKPNANQVGWNNTTFNNSCYSSTAASGSPGSGNPAFNWTDNFTVQGPSGGYGLPQGTGYIKVDMKFNAADPFSYSSAKQLINQKFSIEYRNPNGAGYPNNWVKARDIEGTNLSSESIGGSAPNFLSNGDGVTAYPANYSSSLPQRIQYGCLDSQAPGPSNGQSVYVENGNSNGNNNNGYYSRWVAIGNSPVYNAGTGAGEYRLVAGGLTSRGFAFPSGNYGVRCFNNTPQQIYGFGSIDFGITAGDFYYDFGNNRAFAYKIDTTPHNTRLIAESVSVSAVNQLVYAREPLPRYVSQFYTDPSLDPQYILNLGTGGSMFFAYRPSDTAPSGSSFVANAQANSNLLMAQAAEFAAGDNSVSPSTTLQTSRIWTGIFTRVGTTSSQKQGGSSQPKKA
jgi:hypothetical protein